MGWGWGRWRGEGGGCTRTRYLEHLSHRDMNSNYNYRVWPKVENIYTHISSLQTPSNKLTGKSRHLISTKISLHCMPFCFESPPKSQELFSPNCNDQYYLDIADCCLKRADILLDTLVTVSIPSWPSLMQLTTFFSNKINPICVYGQYKFYVSVANINKKQEQQYLQPR